MATLSGTEGARVLGIEGTAWAASAAVFDAETDAVAMFSDHYTPDSGGLHPREAAEHMREAIPEVVGKAFDAARTGTDDLPGSSAEVPIDAIAFSRGPGLGPCLRVTASAARALAGRLEIPLVGVNHMVAHLEIGRYHSGFEWPIGLNASGANAHLLAYRDGRYRILGETMDTGVGNALDKFARHIGWEHPGGPKIERAAVDGQYVSLPYVVKGMDFSFAGITSAAQAAVDDGVAVPDVCCGLQETVFGMLTEVSERALSLTGRDALVLGGGVGQNERLREMLQTMCADRNVAFAAPPPRHLRDNGAMIAILGAKMAAAGQTVDIGASTVDPEFRPDALAVTWESGTVPPPDPAGADHGAEARIDRWEGMIRKRRVPKGYRHTALDAELRESRLVQEARLTAAARRFGVPTPIVEDVDVGTNTLTLEAVGDADLRDALTTDRVREVATHLATLHGEGIVHGDPTVRNVRVAPDESGTGASGSGRVYLIDFGLGYHSDNVEDHAMDLHVLAQSVDGTASDPQPYVDAMRERYRTVGDASVLDRLDAIAGRGRYR